MMRLALTFNDIFKSSFLEQVDSFAPLDMVIALGLALAIGLFILLIYRKTFSGVMYSASFGLSLLALTLITTLVILAVTSNVVLSLGMVGALSIVRFRTASRSRWTSRSCSGQSPRASSSARDCCRSPSSARSLSASFC